MVPSEQFDEERRLTSVSGETIAVRHRHVMIYLAVFVTVVVLSVGLAYVKVLQSLRHSDSLAHLSPERRRINVLLIGADTREEDVGRSDTLMLISFDPLSGSVGVMSIPRDTRVRIAGATRLRQGERGFCHRRSSIGKTDRGRHIGCPNRLLRAFGFCSL